MIPFPLVTFDTLLIHAQSGYLSVVTSTTRAICGSYLPLNSYQLIVFIEELGCRRRVRHEQPSERNC